MKLAIDRADIQGSINTGLFIPHLFIGDILGRAISLPLSIHTLTDATALLRTDLTAESKARAAADTALSASLTAEAKARSDADGVHTANIAQEVLTEMADREAAVLVVSNSASANALAITAETKAREEKDILLDPAIADEKKRAVAVEGS